MKMQTVLKLRANDDEEEKKVMTTVCWLSGVDSISMDMKYKKLTVIGDIDPVTIVIELRKLCHTEIVSVGPAKEREKKDEKKEEKKKDEPPKKELKIEEPKKDEPKKEDVSELVKKDEPRKKKRKIKEAIVGLETAPAWVQTKALWKKNPKEPKKDEPKNDDVSDLVNSYKGQNPR